MPEGTFKKVNRITSLQIKGRPDVFIALWTKSNIFYRTSGAIDLLDNIGTVVPVATKPRDAFVPSISKMYSNGSINISDDVSAYDITTLSFELYSGVKHGEVF